MVIEFFGLAVRTINQVHDALKPNLREMGKGVVAFERTGFGFFILGDGMFHGELQIINY